jgi:hypothetical protein
MSYDNQNGSIAFQDFFNSFKETTNCEQSWNAVHALNSKFGTFSKTRNRLFPRNVEDGPPYPKMGEFMKHLFSLLGMKLSYKGVKLGGFILRAAFTICQKDMQNSICCLYGLWPQIIRDTRLEAYLKDSFDVDIDNNSLIDHMINEIRDVQNKLAGHNQNNLCRFSEEDERRLRIPFRESVVSNDIDDMLTWS